MLTPKIKNIITWCFSVFCLTSIFALEFSFGTLLLFICGIISLPIKPIKKLWEKLLPNKSEWTKIVVICLAFFIGLALTPSTETAETPSDINGIETTDNGITTETNEIFTHENETNIQENEPEESTGSNDTTIDSPESTAPQSTVKETEPSETTATVPTEPTKQFDYSTIPSFNGKNPYYIVNDNVPYFSQSQYATTSYESYGERDSLNRCSAAIAIIGKDLMPTEERGSIGMVKPSGWQTVKYDCVDGKYLYNRCHLIGYQLTGENANEDNLITGTRFMNNDGMLPFENMVADYIKETNNHVLYRVTPVFIGKELVARGVLMEAYSIEDNGTGICFNVFCYNAQPQVEIDYTNGDSKLIASAVETQAPETQVPETQSPETQPPETQAPATQAPATQSPTTETPIGTDYIGNKNTKVFHYPYCSSVKKMKESNKFYYNGTAEEMEAKGYKSCGNCHP